MSATPPRRISIIAPDLAAGGMTRAYALAQALMHAGHAVDILGVKLTNGALYPLPPSNIRITEVQGRYKLYRLFKLALKLDAEIVYAIKPRLSSYGVALLYRRLSGSPVMLDIDDWEMAEIRAARQDRALTPARQSAPASGFIGGLRQRARTLLRHYRRWLNPSDVRYLRWLDKVICRADAITVDTRLLQELYGGTYVPQCKDTGRYDPDNYSPDDCRRRHGLSDYFVLMFPGTARPHKGLEDILAALDTLQNPAMRLVIVGGRNGCEAYVAQLMQRWAHWIVRLPAFSQEQMPEIVAAAHVIVVPQRDTVIARAQFPIKLTDGMAMAKPIITTRVGDIPEIIGDSGYLVQPSDPAQLAQALTDIVNNPQAAAARGRQARARLVNDYSLGAVCPVLCGIIETLD